MDVTTGKGGTRGIVQRPVYDGTVIFAGYHPGIGYFVQYIIDQLHYETEEYPVITHMHFSERPTVRSGYSVKRGLTILGKTGDSGSYVAPGANHMHLEIRKRKTYSVYWCAPEEPSNGYQSISLVDFDNIDLKNRTENPENYFPGITFTREVPKPTSYSAFAMDFYDEETIEFPKPEILYIIPSSLLDYVGDESEQWIEENMTSKNPDELLTILDFMEYFDITEEEYESVMLQDNMSYMAELVLAEKD